MFRGDNDELARTLGRALNLARGLGHPRAGSEHLLLGLAAGGGAITDVLARHGATRQVLQESACRAAPAGAGAAADRDVLGRLGIDLDRLLAGSGAEVQAGAGAGAAVLDRPPARGPLLPLGDRSARRRRDRANPPLGLDARAAYAASLRLALARREHEHRAEHLALTLVTLDPGVAWVLATSGIDSGLLLADLAAAFPPPRRNSLLRAERRLGHRLRHRDIVRRYQHLTGRTATAGPAIAALIAG
jgi:hypothetical protein